MRDARSYFVDSIHPLYQGTVMPLRARPALRNVCLGIVCSTWLLTTPVRAADAYAAYADRVIAAEKSLESAATWKGLIGYPTFNALASDAGAHVDDCIRFLADPDHTDLQKLLLTYAMYKAPLNEYLDFVRKLAALYDRDPSFGHLIIVAILPHPSHVPSNPIFDNYGRPEVQQLLKEIAARPGWSENSKSNIAWVMEGGDLKYKMHATLQYFGIEDIHGNIFGH